MPAVFPVTFPPATRLTWWSPTLEVGALALHQVVPLAGPLVLRTVMEGLTPTGRDEMIWSRFCRFVILVSLVWV